MTFLQMSTLCVWMCALLALPFDGNCVQSPPGVRAGLYGDLVEKSDFEVVLHPPEESLEDVKGSLDAIMQEEDQKRVAEEDAFSKDKQIMLDAEKNSLRKIVQGLLTTP